MCVVGTSIGIVLIKNDGVRVQRRARDLWTKVLKTRRRRPITKKKKKIPKRLWRLHRGDFGNRSTTAIKNKKK